MNVETLLPEALLPAFDRYYELLIEWNAKFNLTSVTEKNDVFLKHFADSLSGARAFPENASVCDIGSGAGFPGIPLKLLRPDLNVTLIDSLQKRVTFLNEVIQELKLTGIRAEHLRAEDAAKPYREFFDCATARAVAALNTLCEYAVPLVKRGGRFVAYKSAECMGEIAEAARAIKVLGGRLLPIDTFTVEGADGTRLSRALIVIEKVSDTPAGFPRGGNKPKTNPL
ncbi:ribosomal RNA small subunit methyltransferase G [Clostridia bacterium]|nr:ribosomal RNA small subunit methyltransferase G [Clostridia bacterium]